VYAYISGIQQKPTEINKMQIENTLEQAVREGRALIYTDTDTGELLAIDEYSDVEFALDSYNEVKDCEDYTVRFMTIHDLDVSGTPSMTQTSHNGELMNHAILKSYPSAL